MNEKGNKLHQIVEMVVECCSMDINGIRSVSVADVLGKSRSENVVLTRQIVAMQLSHFGYTNTTIAMLLGCSVVNVRKLLADGYHNIQTRQCFNFAYSEATIKCKSLCAM